MKHTPSWTLVTLLCLLLAAGAAVLVLTPRTVPFDECSPLYRQYAGQEGIKASYVRDYPVDDTTLVDVTLLRATTDSAWESLCIAFTPYEFSDSSEYIHNLIHDTTSVTFRVVSKDDYRVKVTPATANNFDFFTLTAMQKSICIFHTKNNEQLCPIMDKMVTQTLTLKQSNLL